MYPLFVVSGIPLVTPEPSQLDYTLRVCILRPPSHVRRSTDDRNEHLTRPKFTQYPINANEQLFQV